jgi:hypothetical protein
MPALPALRALSARELGKGMYSPRDPPLAAKPPIQPTASPEAFQRSIPAIAATAVARQPSALAAAPAAPAAPAAALIARLRSAAFATLEELRPPPAVVSAGLAAFPALPRSSLAPLLSKPLRQHR